MVLLNKAKWTMEALGNFRQVWALFWFSFDAAHEPAFLSFEFYWKIISSTCCQYELHSIVFIAFSDLAQEFLFIVSSFIARVFQVFVGAHSMTEKSHLEIFALFCQPSSSSSLAVVPGTNTSTITIVPRQRFVAFANTVLGFMKRSKAFLSKVTLSPRGTKCDRINLLCAVKFYCCDKIFRFPWICGFTVCTTW